jgi:NADH dehydrogenase (ubiquinone) Fe-S protein 3
MASKLCRSQALARALRPARSSIQNEAAAARCFSATANAGVGSYAVKLPKDAKDFRKAERQKTLGSLEAPIVNPADKYQSKADNLHRYGAWLMGVLPKYIQQFSVWKDELTIYISPSGVIPVFSFLKCTSSCSQSVATLWAVSQPVC